jgi:hypothetical protein
MSSVTLLVSHGKPLRLRELMYPRRNTDTTTVIALMIRMSIATCMLHDKPWRLRRSMYPRNHAITASTMIAAISRA